MPKSKQILVTAHNAFNYFSKRYGFEVVGLQGISSATEAGVQDVQWLSNFIMAYDYKPVLWDIDLEVPEDYKDCILLHYNLIHK